MTTYLVTTELKTSWWWKVLRFFRLKSKRNDFYLTVAKNVFEKNEILDAGKSKVKIIEQI